MGRQRVESVDRMDGRIGYGRPSAGEAVEFPSSFLARVAAPSSSLLRPRSSIRVVRFLCLLWTRSFALPLAPYPGPFLSFQCTVATPHFPLPLVAASQAVSHLPLEPIAGSIPQAKRVSADGVILVGKKKDSLVRAISSVLVPRRDGDSIH